MWLDFREITSPCNWLLQLDLNREEFDEEKEPDGMVLSGWTQAPAVEKKDENHVGNGVGTSKNVPTSAEQAETNEDVEIVPADIEIPADKKRKLAEISNSDGMGTSRVAAETNNHSKVEELDDDDDVVFIWDGDSDPSKKRKLH